MFPLPEPLLPAVIVIHESLRTAVHVQAGSVFIENPPVPPPAPIFELWEDSENEQPEAWLTVNVFPPAVIVPDRALSEFGSTLNEMSPLAVPELPPVIVIHGALLTAVQRQPPTVVIVNMPVPPAADMLVLLGPIE